MKYQPIIFGISGTILTPEEKEFFNNNPVLGFILFERNIDNSNQLKHLVQNLKSLYPSRDDILILMDQEGGKVARIKPPIIENTYHPAKHFGDIYKTEGRSTAIELTEAQYANIMFDLQQFEINSPCGPVCDLTHANTTDAIGDRSFSDNPEIVIDLAKAAINGIQEAGGIPIIKHIPGHGRAICDSHFSLPRVSKSLESLEATDFRIFQQLSLENAVQYAMTAHIIYEAIDPKTPITMSRQGINYIRDQISFNGKLISDDICMKALHMDSTSESEYSLASVTLEILHAGCDIVLHCSGDINEMHVVYNASTQISSTQIT